MQKATSTQVKEEYQFELDVANSNIKHVQDKLNAVI